MEYIILFFIGIALGSFVNVLALRYQPDKKNSWHNLRGRSYCDHCSKQLRWYELIPVLSFVIQKRKCRSCKKNLSWQYPIVELAMGLIAVGIGIIFLHGFPYLLGVPTVIRYISVAFWLAISAVLAQAFLVDLYHRIIPNGSNLFLFVAGIVWTVFLAVMYSSQRVGMGSFLGSYAQLWQWDSILVNHILGMIIASGFFFLIVLISRGKGMGMGDVKLIGSLGLLFGWPDIALIIIGSFVVGTIGVLPLLIMRKKKGKDAIPFGPFIVLASFAVMFWGAGLLQAYFDIIQKLGETL